VHRLEFYNRYRGGDALKINYKQIDQLERDQLAIHRSKGLSFSAIGQMLGRSGSALSREYKRNLNDNGNYLPSEAEHQAKRRKKWAAETGSKCEPYEDNIYSRLCEGWTPEQIAGKLSKEEKTFTVSHETIYQFIYKLHIDWASLLPRKHTPRWHKKMGKKFSKRDMIPNRVSILERPIEIDNKGTFGHWEGDSIVCSQSIVSLNVMVERQTQYVSISRVENRGPEATNQAMEDSLKRFKTEHRQSITLDNGIEFKYHEKLKKALNIRTYFCQPYHSWEKGFVEQINGLIRRFLPKKNRPINDHKKGNRRDRIFIEFTS
jgi:IS30 family transposase